jgi:peptide/nickel transport system ATP-binding protein
MNATDTIHDPLVSVRDLSIKFRLDKTQTFEAVKGISFDIPRNSTVALVGESGSGKSVTSLAILGLLPPENSIVDRKSQILYGGKNLVGMSMRKLQKLRGADISMIFQEPMTSLNPVFTCGYQLEEVLKLHIGLSGAKARKRALELLDEVGIPDPSHKINAYPSQMSGGQQQRVMIAMAIACEPKLLIADEPTTALDVTIQAQILALIVDLQNTLGTGLILITHDLGVVAQTAQRVIVMYAGRKVEEATVEALFENPRHPYTRGLMASMPEVISEGTRADARLTEIPGMVPSLTNLPPGCAFAPRCTLAIDRCRAEYPPLQDFDGHLSACWRAAEMVAAP